MTRVLREFLLSLSWCVFLSCFVFGLHGVRIGWIFFFLILAGYIIKIANIKRVDDETVVFGINGNVPFSMVITVFFSMLTVIVLLSTVFR